MSPGHLPRGSSRKATVPKVGEGIWGPRADRPEPAALKGGSLWKPGCTSGVAGKAAFGGRIRWALGAWLSRGNLRAPGKYLCLEPEAAGSTAQLGGAAFQ